ncbi:MAG: potassium channel protein [Nitrospinae bacterium]|nr:potassium channel protein [Nitrospinota bacterium]
MRISYIAVSLVGIVILGTAGYVLLEGWSIVEAFYMTMITVTTVGFNEVRELSTTGRMLTVALMILGVGTLFYGIAIIAEIRFEERIRQIFGRRKLVKELDRLENHHIICGHGRIGSTVAGEYARESLPHVIIESDESIAAHLDQEGKLVILGDATLDETLMEAHVEKAKSLVCALATDAENVFVTLTARALNPDIFILSRAALDSSIGKMEAAGADRVVSPYIMGGMRMAQSVLRPKLAGFLDEVTGHATTDLDFDEVTVPEGSDLVGMALRESKISQETGVYLLSIRHASGEMRFNPGPDFQIQAGDHLYALGTPAQVESLRKRVLAK